MEEQPTLPKLPTRRPSSSSSISKRSRISTGSTNRKQLESSGQSIPDVVTTGIRPITAPSRLSNFLSPSRATWKREWKARSVYDPVIKEARKEFVLFMKMLS